MCGVIVHGIYRVAVHVIYRVAVHVIYRVAVHVIYRVAVHVIYRVAVPKLCLGTDTKYLADTGTTDINNGRYFGDTSKQTTVIYIYI